VRTPHFPPSAVWLLETFGITRDNPALIGDLTEEISGGRSCLWLWRQVLAAIAFTVGRKCYDHKLLSIRAIVAGQAVLTLGFLDLKVARAHWFSMIPFMWSRYVTSSYPSLFRYPFVKSESIVLFMFAGWIVARLHRENRIALVLFFAMLQLILNVALSSHEIHRLWVNSIDQPRFWPYLATEMTLVVLCPIAVLLGGYLAGARRMYRSSAGGNT
jgi:hypothetical protein